MTIDVSQLSETELKELRQKADERLRERNRERILEIRREARELARDLDITVEEVFGVSRGAKKMRKKVAPKYMHPNDPSKTWTGRGKRPNWLSAEIEQGKSLEDFAI